MNCGGFQKRLEDYLDGALSRRARDGAETHLSGCAACRQALARRAEMARRLSGQLRESVRGLQLTPEVRQRVLRGAAAESKAKWPNLAGWSVRPPWRWGVLGGAALAVVLLMLRQNVFAPRKPVAQAPAPSPAVIEASYRVPVRFFRKEGDFVRDTLAYQTVILNARLSAEKSER